MHNTTTMLKPSLVTKHQVERTPAHPSATRRMSRHVVLDLLAIADLLAMAAGAFLVALLRGGSGVDSFHFGLRDAELCLINLTVAHAALRDAGAYKAIPFQAASLHPLRFTAVLVAAFGGVFATASAVGATSAGSGGWFADWFAASFTFIALEKMILGLVLRRAVQAGHLNTNIAVYGAGRVASRIADQAATPGSGLKLVGVYDERSADRTISMGQTEIAGNLEDLIAAGRFDQLDEIIIALPNSADGRIAELASRLEHLPVRLSVCTHVVSDLVDIGDRTQAVRSLGQVGLLDVRTKPLRDWAPLLKRLEDIVIAGIAVVCLVPLFFLIGIAIKWDSPGPVLFRQRRHGLNHRVFNVLKFRTMLVTENGGTVVQAQRGDPRVTRVGRLLRRTSLDELPQLLNIVLGDMSLVGPRPHAIAHNEHYGELVERYANRHRVKPGLTGWAQVNGFRGETSTPEAMKSRVVCDLDYIENWSLLLDVHILCKTMACGFVHRNAF